ncbi:unnamed protein product [Somion occarium]|uniref:Uncharacterized protein n=1 Tax=Somion occarium TaxID=3059160 RepID=A0ABP1EAI5_9APHY
MAPSRDNADWKVYARQMLALNYGLALWQPSPSSRHKQVQIGDVGYIRDGSFRLLFNAAKPTGAVPEGFVPLQIGTIHHNQPRSRGLLWTKSIKLLGTGGGWDFSQAPIPANAAVFYSFQTTTTEGAALLTRHKTHRSDAEQLGRFQKYIRKHYKSWLRFANSQLEYAITVDDLLLVTGCDMTKDYSMLAFTENQQLIGFDFRLRAGSAMSVGASTWASWECQFPTFQNWGPQPMNNLDKAISWLDTPKRTQCVFVRGYRIRERAKVIPTVIEAGAEPPNPGNDVERRGDSGGLATSANYTAQHYDPLYPIFEYISKESAADLAIIHDNDFSELFHIDSNADAGTLTDVLHKWRPKIRIEDGAGIVHFENVSLLRDLQDSKPKKAANPSSEPQGQPSRPKLNTSPSSQASVIISGKICI